MKKYVYHYFAQIKSCENNVNFQGLFISDEMICCESSHNDFLIKIMDMIQENGFSDCKMGDFTVTNLSFLHEVEND